MSPGERASQLSSPEAERQDSTAALLARGRAIVFASECPGLVTRQVPKRSSRARFGSVGRALLAVSGTGTDGQVHRLKGIRPIDVERIDIAADGPSN
jgi:hypothetical protein